MKHYVHRKDKSVKNKKEYQNPVQNLDFVLVIDIN